MSDMKCPFCNQELRKISATSFLVCDNCNITGFDKLWQELIRTRKALDVAVDAIKNATEYLGNQEPLVDVMAMNLHIDLSKALEQITATLENQNGNC